MKTTKYKHLVLWCRMMGSFDHYTQQQIAKAEQLNAPLNIIYFNGDNYSTFDNVTNPTVIEYFKQHNLI